MYLKLITASPYPKFEVYEEDKVVMRIKIDPEMQAVRITHNENRRVFFLAEEKLRKMTVTTLLNEYSQPLGTLIKDKSNGSGKIEVEGTKLRYSMTDRPNKEITLFEINTRFEVLNCKIENEALLPALNNISYLLFSLSWFTFLVKEKKEDLQFA